MVGCSNGAANFVREGSVTVTDVVRIQSLVILHKDHFDVTAQRSITVVPNLFRLATPYREKYIVRDTQWPTYLL